MKEVIRKLKLFRYDKKIFEGISKQYFVVYYNGEHDILNTSELEYALLHPRNDKSIRYIFGWEDRLNIKTEFEEGNNEESKNIYNRT